MIEVSVNGETTELDEGSTIAELLTRLGGGQKGVAVAVNGEVVSRTLWDKVVLGYGDRVEVLRAVGGG